jgi:hypothetical protein
MAAINRHIGKNNWKRKSFSKTEFPHFGMVSSRVIGSIFVISKAVFSMGILKSAFPKGRISVNHYLPIEKTSLFGLQYSPQVTSWMQLRF